MKADNKSKDRDIYDASKTLKAVIIAYTITKLLHPLGENTYEILLPICSIPDRSKKTKKINGQNMSKRN